MPKLDVKVPVSIEHHTKLNLDCSHVTTMGFGRIQPVNYRHMIRTEKIDMTCNSVVRPAPIEVPVYGKITQNIRSFFVPYRLVFPNWLSYINDNIQSNQQYSSLVGGLPYFTNVDLNDMFFLSGVGTLTNLEDGLTITYHDFVYEGTGFALTSYGRRCLKILESLGYKVIPEQKGESNHVFYNALALLAYARVFYDWYVNQNYRNSSAFLAIDRLFKYNDPVTALKLTPQIIRDILAFCDFVCYDNENYYVNCYDNPVSPSTGQSSFFSFQDPTNLAFTIVTDSAGTPYMTTASSTSIGTQYIHDALERLSSYQKKHQLSSLSVDRVLSEYGIVSDFEKLDRSVYLGYQSVDVQIGSVMATSTSTDGSQSSSVGDYSGAGFGKSSKDWSFTASEEGILIVVASILPSAHIWQGYDRMNRLYDKTEWFHPSFDNLSVDAIERGEVYVSDNNSFGNSEDYIKPFGYVGRYGYYKRPKNFVTGDIRLPNFYSGGSSWHLNRIFTDGEFGNNTLLVHSEDFTKYLDEYRYNRIFQYTDTDYDPFYCFLSFAITTYAPCKPLFDTFEWPEESAKSVGIDNGAKVN